MFPPYGYPPPHFDGLRLAHHVAGVHGHLRWFSVWQHRENERRYEYTMWFQNITVTDEELHQVRDTNALLRAVVNIAVHGMFEHMDRFLEEAEAGFTDTGNDPRVPVIRARLVSYEHARRFTPDDPRLWAISYL